MIQDNSEQIIKFIDNIEFSWKKKNWRMRILGAVFFLSFLAGKFATFDQMLLTDWIIWKKMAHVY